MRIVVNDLAASKTGALTVLRSFYEYVKENETDDEWVFLLSDDLVDEADHIQVVLIPWVKKSWLHKLWFDFARGKRVIDKLRPDYVLSLQNIITFSVRTRQGVYIHQSIPFQSTKRFSFLKSDERIYAVYQHIIGRIIKRSARLADDVFVQTQWMKRAVAQRSRIDEGKITVVPIVTKTFIRDGVAQETGRFFYPAGFEAKYKNHECLYRACDLLDAMGAGVYQVDVTLHESSRPTSRHITFVGQLDYEQMNEEYCVSTLVFPSYIETVGLPLLEAAQIGARILAADCEYAREALRGYDNVCYFDPFSAQELAELMLTAMEANEDPRQHFEQCAGGVSMYHEATNPWSNLVQTIKM